MPCNDVTELIQVELDEQDNLKTYRFIKKTCGQGVGHETLLHDVLGGMRVDDILAINPGDFTHIYPVDSSIEEFLTLKHLVAVQSVLEVLTGKISGTAKDMCAVSGITFDCNITRIDARISVDLVTERIKSCGGCKACGKTRKKPQPVLFN